MLVRDRKTREVVVRIWFVLFVLWTSTACDGTARLSGECAQNDVARNQGIEVIFFDATWCGACKKQRPIMKTIKRENRYVGFHRLDADKHRGLVDCYGVEAYPTIVIKSDGLIVQKLVGTRSKESLQELIDRYDRLRKQGV